MAILICSQCGTENPSSDFYCSKCRASLHMGPGSRVSPLAHNESSSQDSGALASRSKAAASIVVERYTDAYRVGSAIVGIGTAIKVLGGIVAGLVFLVSLSSGSGPLGTGGLVMGIVLALVIGGVAWIWGVIVTAQGQILRATLDNAVSNSPFLTNRERAEAMGLPIAIADRALGV